MEGPADESGLSSSLQKDAIKRLVKFHFKHVQELLNGQPVAEEAVDLLEDSKIVMDGGASAEILEWHLAHIQELTRGLPDEKIAPAFSVLRLCISHAKSVGL